MADPKDLDSGKQRNAAAQASLELLYEIGREVATALDLRMVLNRVLFLSMKSAGASSGSIIVVDENGQPVESAYLVHGQTRDRTLLQLRVTYESGMAGWVARHKQAVLVPDTSRDERWIQRPDAAKRRSGRKSAMSAPILARGILVGVITLVHPTPGFFTPDHLELLKAIADQAGTGIRNAQLFENLEAAHKRYRELFEDSIDPILITDREGRILEANRRAEETTAMLEEDLCSSTIADFHDIDWDKVGTGFEKLVPEGTISYESALHPRNRRDIPVQVYVRSIAYENVNRLQWILRDISERKDLDSLREDLIAMVYHDLRSPLMNIVSSLEVLSTMESLQDDEIARSLFNIALRSTERIQRLTSSLLDVNRLEAGQTIGNRHPASPAELVEDALDEVQIAADNKKLDIVSEVSPGLPNFLVDVDMIRRVLINLLENAVKFTPVGGKIRVGAQPQNGYIQIWVSDSGPGIPEADFEHIFEKFTRLSVAEAPKGLGLGLAFCRLAVAGHGGRIWVESKVGKGATFRFALPIDDTTPS